MHFVFINYWRDVVEENPGLLKFVLFKLLPFVATCVCEVEFSQCNVTCLNDAIDWKQILVGASLGLEYV